MPRIGVSITKSTPFRNSVQEFSNVYYYDVGSVPTVTQAEGIIDNIVTIEKTFHASGVTFVRGRCWTETGNKATNEMITQKNLSGVGNQSTASAMDKERAVLFRLRAGTDTRGNPVYLRKWYHPCGQFDASVTFSTSHLDNTSGFTTAQRSTFAAKLANIGDANGHTIVAKLCAKSGRQVNAGANWEAHQFLEHHQLGDMWRAQ
jgi:hypothetical protein